MHELSLAQGLIEQLHTLAAEHKAERILRITVVIGPFSGIVVDSFSFGFDALKQESPVIREAVLEIDVPPPSYTCLDCEQVFSLEQEHHGVGQMPHGGLSKDTCIACSSHRLAASGGDELILKQIEME